MDLRLSSITVLIFPRRSRSSESDFLSHLFVQFFRMYSLMGDVSPCLGEEGRDSDAGTGTSGPSTVDLFK